jgi:DNA-directed RNA polymerase subunit alpha
MRLDCSWAMMKLKDPPRKCDLDGALGLGHGISFADFQKVMENSFPPSDDIRQQNFLKKSINGFDLSARAMNALKRNNILDIQALVQKTESELLRMVAFGRKSLNEVKDLLEQENLYLGMNLDFLENS